MRARLMVAIMLMLTAGCDEKVDPATSPLAEGSRALVFDPRVESVKVAVGIPVLVLGDDENPRNPKRNVRVRIQEGENKGIVVIMPREQIRP